MGLKNEKSINMNEAIISLVSGSTAGAVAKTAIAPFDRTKITFQTNAHLKFTISNAFNYLTTRARNEGIKSLWRGNSATMIRIIPYAGIQFTAHEFWKGYLGITNPLEHPAYLRFLAGSLAGVTASSLTYPLDVARARMAVTERNTYSNLGQVFVKMRHEGWISMYRGLLPTLMGSVPYSGLSFFTYETLKGHYRQRLAEPRALKSYERLAFGAISGALGQTLSYPLDIVRRRMQTATEAPSAVSSAWQKKPIGTRIYTALILIMKSEGFKGGLYKGLSLNWIKGPLAVGISFATYDAIRDLLFGIENLFAKNLLNLSTSSTSSSSS